jgi:hypothetical protein
MSKPTYRYAITSGLHGCYMPDTHWGAYEGHRRKDLADLIRDHLRLADMPACLFERVAITSLWKAVKKHGSSSMHFTIVHKDYELAFHGLTEKEYKDIVIQNEWLDSDW